VSGSRTTRRRPHCLGTSPHAQSRDGSSLQLPRDVQATPCSALVTSCQARPATGTLCRSSRLTPWHSTRPPLRWANDLPENAKAVQRYLEHEHAFQEELLASLRSDPHYRPYATEERVERNRLLVGIWDAISLARRGTYTNTHQRVCLKRR
jgi:hypothetical protein